MAVIEFEKDAVSVDAAVIGDGLGLAPADVHAAMREGEITQRCERGIDEDAGRYRLTFFYRNRRLRLVIDEAGNILRRSAVDFGDRQLPASMRRPGP